MQGTSRTLKMKKEMDNDYLNMEGLLPGYLSGELSGQERALVDQWRLESRDHENLYTEYRKAWETLPVCQIMEQFNSFEALRKVRKRLSAHAAITWKSQIQRVAAIFAIPLLIYSGYVTFKNSTTAKHQEGKPLLQTVDSRQGMVTNFELADGTKVWLNSGSSLQFPRSFAEDLRNVKLSGEAFFEVAKDEKKPFRVEAGGLQIDVLGTSFNVTNYAGDKQAEVVLVEGEVNLFTMQGNVKQEFGTLSPGQRAIYREDTRKVISEGVETDKYTAWREGNLIFRNDNMEEVIKRLSRWFNVEIIVKDPDIKNYGYKASFRNETLTQVLNLLKLSAPIDYQITGNTLMKNGEYTKQKVYLMKRE